MEIKRFDNFKLNESKQKKFDFVVKDIIDNIDNVVIYKESSDGQQYFFKYHNKLFKIYKEYSMFTTKYVLYYFNNKIETSSKLTKQLYKLIEEKYNQDKENKIKDDLNIFRNK